MLQLNNNQSEELRHERKFLITGYSSKEVEQIIKNNPACFTKIYHPRTINNIYFDSPAFDSYYSNVEGDMNRTKARIRWYGELFGDIEGAVLEFKIKRGLLGRKESYFLKPFTLNESFSKQEIVKALKGQVPQNVRDMMISVYPVLLNSYSRRYFLSADKKFRLTIDSDQLFYGISYNGNTFLNKVKKPESVVLELKYDSKHEEEANDVSNAFPFPMTKNSKYLQGVERVLF